MTLEFLGDELHVSQERLDSVYAYLGSFDEQAFISNLFVYQNQGSARTNDMVDDYFASFSNNLTMAQRSYVGKMLYICKTYDYDINLLQSKLSNVETQIGTNVSPSERDLLYTAVDVAKQSANFWNANAEAYASEINYITSGGSYEIDPDGGGTVRTKNRPAWGMVAAADVAAAASVGLATSTALVVPFVGWTFWGCVTAGGAIITSGATAIMSYYYCTTPCS